MWYPLFFFATHVVQFFGSAPVRMLLAAATLNLSKLGQAGLIIVLTVYVYAVVGFQLFKDKHAEGKCSTLLNCAISYLDGGLTGGGIHDALEFNTPHSVWDTELLEWFLQLFAMSFLTIYVQVLLAIFSGIIIDSFGELRDQHQEVASHLHDSHHLLSQYSHWHYVHLLIYMHLMQNQRDKLTDLERFVLDQVSAKSSEWLPYRHRLAPDSLGDTQIEDQAAVAVATFTEEVSRVNTQLASVTDRLDDMKRSMDRLERDLTDRVDAVEDSKSTGRITRPAPVRRGSGRVPSPTLDTPAGQGSTGRLSPPVPPSPAAGVGTGDLMLRMDSLEREMDKRWRSVESSLADIAQALATRPLEAAAGVEPTPSEPQVGVEQPSGVDARHDFGMRLWPAAQCHNCQARCRNKGCRECQERFCEPCYQEHQGKCAGRFARRATTAQS
mmetsp:Transcript_52003/g.118701  ORF Transcript_52003/g.118701 Transcript_52003/m.118701 type:complete len:440 (+) Transcript_52003:2930-4249(+)